LLNCRRPSCCTSYTQDGDKSLANDVAWSAIREFPSLHSFSPPRLSDLSLPIVEQEAEVRPLQAARRCPGDKAFFTAKEDGCQLTT
jgi:hypothetical protein